MYIMTIQDMFFSNKKYLSTKVNLVASSKCYENQLE